MKRKETTKKDKPSGKQASESPDGLPEKRSTPSTSFDSSPHPSSHQSEESASGSAIGGSDIPQITVAGAASASPSKYSKSKTETIARKLSLSPKKTIDASPKKTIDASPKKTIDASPKKTIDASPKENIDASESPRKSGQSVKGAVAGAVSSLKGAATSVKGAATSVKEALSDAATSIKGAIKGFPRTPEKESLITIESESEPPPRAKSKKPETVYCDSIETYLEFKESPMNSTSPTDSTSLRSSEVSSPPGSNKTSSDRLSLPDANKSPDKFNKPSLLD